MAKVRVIRIKKRFFVLCGVLIVGIIIGLVSCVAGRQSEGSVSAEEQTPPRLQCFPQWEISLPEKQKSREMFDTAVFIGDSRTQGLMLYGGLNNTTFYADKGFNVSSVSTHAFIPSENGTLTVLQALQGRQFDRIYIMLGVNELGTNTKRYYENNVSFIREIKKIQPDAKIILQSILPIGKERSDRDKIVNNYYVNQFNDVLRHVAKQERVYFVDVGSAFRDQNGFLQENYSTDGVHLNKEGCLKWIQYLIDTKEDTYELPEGFRGQYTDLYNLQHSFEDPVVYYYTFY